MIICKLWFLFLGVFDVDFMLGFDFDNIIGVGGFFFEVIGVVDLLVVSGLSGSDVFVDIDMFGILYLKIWVRFVDLFWDSY